MPKFTWTPTSLIVVREAGDPKFYGTAGAKGESNFLYWLKTILNSEGRDLIKKRMWKDGHMVDDLQQYLRTRKLTPGGMNTALYNDHWAISGLNDDWNTEGKAILRLTALEPETKPSKKI